MSASSDRVRGIGLRAELRRVVLGAVCTVFVVVGLVGVSEALVGDGVRVLATWFFVLVLGIGASGLVGVVQQGWFVRHRPGVALGTAPSGAPATVVLRSSFTTGMSIVVTGALALYLGAATVALLAAGYAGAAATGALTALLVWPLVPAARGRISPGALYLTAAGLEHRRDAVLWSLPWSAVTGAVPGEPVALVLREGQAGAETSSTTPWVWNREVPAPRGVVAVDCRTLGLDGVLVAAAVNTALALPARRAELGTEPSLGWVRA
jgi:hypothetical protein